MIVRVSVSSKLFMLIPFVEKSLIGLLVVIMLFNIAMAFYRAPAVSMMPDFVPPEQRSQGNG